MFFFKRVNIKITSSNLLKVNTKITSNIFLFYLGNLIISFSTVKIFSVQVIACTRFCRKNRPKIYQDKLKLVCCIPCL